MACQTVRRPPAFYAHMMAEEMAALAGMPERTRALLGSYEGLRGDRQLPRGGDANESSGLARWETDLPGLARPAQLSQVSLLADEDVSERHLFPEALFDQDLQQVDLRERNSWRLLLAEVPSVELLEVHLVNAIAPFIINAPPETADASNTRARQSTSSTSRRWKGSSTGSLRRRVIRIPIWRRRRST